MLTRLLDRNDYGLLLFAAALALAATAVGAADRTTPPATWPAVMAGAIARCQASPPSAREVETLWQKIETEFPLAAIRFQMDQPEGDHLKWFTTRGAGELALLARPMIGKALEDLGPDGTNLRREFGALARRPDFEPRAALELYDKIRIARKLAADLKDKVNFAALRLAVADLERSHPGRYRTGAEALGRAAALEARLPAVRQALVTGTPAAQAQVRAYIDEFIALQREALLANPLLDFDKLLLIRRTPMGNPYRSVDPDKGTGRYIGMPQQSSWQLHTMKGAYVDTWDNEIATLTLNRPEAPLASLFHSTGKRLLTDMDLHFDGGRILFSMPDERKLWQLYEFNIAGRTLRQVSRGDQPDVHSLDGCYLPDGGIAFISTADFQGVPCNAGVNVGMLYRMDGQGGNVRQLCFDQDHNFCPTVTADGRILYMRWEYADIPHVWARYLFTMNPDGTGQRELFGTGSYWPNGIYYARPIPNSSTKVAGIVVGHHLGRQGELVVFDPARSHDGTAGALQRIPGRGKPIPPVITDKLTDTSWPKFLHPYPLSDKYFLVACRPSPEDLWGIYLADVFDNLVPIKVIEGQALLEPLPLRPIRKPPVVESRVNLKRKDALIFIENIYKGQSMPGVPLGTVKSLRLVSFHFAYRTVAGIDHRVGADGPWEPKLILGTVPVDPDGSAFFRVPANIPLTVQALDAQGRAIQSMRSWMTPMPGEVLSCVGCHDKANGAPPNKAARSVGRTPAEITPWHGPARGLSFIRDVQPALDKYCVGCHDGRDPARPDLRRDPGYSIAYRKDNPQAQIIRGPLTDALHKQYGGIFTPAYIALRALVRPAGIESDLRPLNPMEFDVRTSELIQMLEKGHHGVKLDAEAWDRLVTWIDMNTPCHGTWREVVGSRVENDRQRRKDMKRLYGTHYEDPEQVPPLAAAPVNPILPADEVKATRPVGLAGWPFGAAEARQRQGGAARRTIDLGEGITLELVRIPAGRFVMGNPAGASDEQPAASVEIARPFWMGVAEVTNEQFRRFDPAHDSRYEHKGTWKFEEVDLGWPLNGPRQPVVRVSWGQADAFCEWLSARVGGKFSLPSEAQWEYACRAGAATPFFFGDLSHDFAPFANLADASLRELSWGLRSPRPPDLTPRVDRFSDGAIVTSDVGRYRANPWGLCDMHGNAWEWTRSAFKPYPYKADDGREAPDAAGMRVVRGGSWGDRPARCTASYRLAFPAWQKVYNVGFRVMMAEEEMMRVAARAK